MGLAISGMAPAVVTWEGLRAWAGFMNLDLEPWEARTMIEMGYRRAVIESEAKPKASSSSQGKP